MPTPSSPPVVEVSDSRPMHDYANFQYTRKQTAEQVTSEQVDYVNYSQGRAVVASSVSTTATDSSCSLPNLTPPPSLAHLKEQQGYEQLRQTFGDKFAFIESDVVHKTRQEERDEVYVPFTPGHAPSKSSVEMSRGSPPLKKAADYMPFVPISERKSDPCILDRDREPSSGSGYLSSLQRNSESDPELAQLRSKSKYSRERKPFDYLPFVPLAQTVKTATETQQKTSEEERECKGETENDVERGKECVGEDNEVFPPSKHSSCHSDKMADQEHTTPSDPPPEEGSEEDSTPQVDPPRLSNATSSCSTGEDDSKTVSEAEGRNSAEDSNERHHPVAGEELTPSVAEVNPPVTNPRKGDSAYFMHRIEAGDSSASSGENSPSPRVQSVAMSGSMSWNGNNNNNNNNKQVIEGLPPDEGVNGGLRHSDETSSPAHPMKDKEDAKSSTAEAKQHTKVATMVQKFQGNLPRQRMHSRQLRRPSDAAKKHQSNTQAAFDRLSTSSYKSTASSSSQSSPPPPRGPRQRKQSCLESMGIVEDTVGGTFAV